MRGDNGLPDSALITRTKESTKTKKATLPDRHRRRCSGSRDGKVRLGGPRGCDRITTITKRTSTVLCYLDYRRPIEAALLVWSMLIDVCLVVKLTISYLCCVT
jgi:hypothetical protein